MKKISFIIAIVSIFSLFNIASAAITTPGTPTIGVATKLVDQNKVTVSYTPPASNGGSPITSYTVTSSPAGLTATGSTNPITVSGLANNVGYKFQIKATNSVGSSGVSGWTNTVEFSEPTAPIIDTATLVTDQHKASVSFTPPASDGGMSVTLYTVTSSIGNLTATGTTTPIIVSGLVNNVAYTFSVKATNSAGVSAPSGASNSVKITVPGAPTVGFASLIQNQNKASVSFVEPVSDGGFSITSYTVTSNTGGLTATGTTSPITVPGLVNNVAYTFSVKAINSAGVSAASGASNSVKVTTPGTPTIDTVTLITDQRKASVSFFEPAFDGGLAVTSYTVTSNPSGLTATGTSSPIIVSSLANNTSYKFQVKANNVIGSSAVSAWTSTVEVTVPDAPVIGPAILITNQNKASVYFAPPASDGGMSVTSYVVTSNTGGLTATGTTNPITVSGLLDGQAYTFSVQAKNVVGTSDASAESNSVKIGAPPAPTIGTATLLNGQNKASISFSQLSNGGSPITSFTVVSSPTGLTATGVTSPITVSGLVEGTTYKFAVKATNADGVSPLSVYSNNVKIGLPAAPVIGTAVFLKEAQNVGKALVSFTPSITDTPDAFLYTAYSNTGNLTTSGTSSPITISGLVKNTSYSFTVKATNSYGTSSASSASNSLKQTAPSAPTAVVAAGWVWGGDFGDIKVSWTPASDGGSEVVAYKVFANGIQAKDVNGNPVIASSSPVRVGKLLSGTAYKFTVSATNVIGTSPLSSASAAITGSTVSEPPASLGGCLKVELANGDYYYACNGIQITQTARVLFDDYITNFNVVGSVISWSYYDGLNKIGPIAYSTDQASCDESTRPSPQCVEGKLKDYVCSANKTCESTDTTKKFFNIGIPYDSTTIVNYAKFDSWASDVGMLVARLAITIVASVILPGIGTVLAGAGMYLSTAGVVIDTAVSTYTVASYTQDVVSVIQKDYDTKGASGKGISVNVCDNIPGLSNGDSFYVLADTIGSQLPKYRYYLYQFTKGHEEGIVYDPGGKKRDVNSAVYNGSCKVYVSNTYVGAPTEYGATFASVVEIGKVPAVRTDMCKSQIVSNDNSRVFWEKTAGNLLDVNVCGSGEISDKYINGSEFAETVHIDRRSGVPVVDVCSQLGITPSDLSSKISGGESFYVMENLSGSWIPMKYPVYQFTFGKAENSTYWATGSKRIYSTVDYDGSCNIGFKVQYSGDDTNYPNAYVSYYETGLVKDVKCYSPIVATQNVSRSKYPVSYYAPFLSSVRTCLNESSCTLSPRWVDSFTYDCIVATSTNRLFANPSTIYSGASSTLTWNSNASSTKSIGDWTANTAANGSQVVNNILNTTSYSMSFITGADTAYATATVTVIKPPCFGLSGCPSSPNFSVVSGVASCIQEVRLTWSPITDATNYNIYRAPTLSDPFVLIGNVAKPTTTYTDSAVSASSTYYYKMKACDTLGGCSSFSAPTSAVVVPDITDPICLGGSGNCTVSNASPFILNQASTWTVNSSCSNCTYEWSGTGISTSTPPTGISLRKIYTTLGLKSVSVKVFNDDGSLYCPSGATATTTVILKNSSIIER